MAETTTTRKPRTAKAVAAPKAEVKAETETGRGPLNQLKNKLRNDAEREVLRNHRDEVVALTKAKFEEAGIEYVHRLTPEEKAKKEIEEQLNQFPELREQFESDLAKQIRQQILAEMAAEQGADEPGEDEYPVPGPDFNPLPDNYYEEAAVEAPTPEQLRG